MSVVDRRNQVGLCAVLALGLLARPALAQPADGGLSRLREALLHEVRVTDAGGYQRTGILESIEGNRLRLLTGEGPVEFEPASLRRIERRGDSLRNGIAIGIGVGIFNSLMARQGYSDTDAWMTGAVIVTGLYALLGAGIDAMHNGWTTVSSSNPPRPLRHPAHDDRTHPRAGSSSDPAR